MPSYQYQRYRPNLPNDIPGTNFIIAANAASFILLFLNLFPVTVYNLLVSDSLTVWRKPWTFFTYALVTRPADAWKFINLLIALWWLYVVGGLLERTWGTSRFLIRFFAFSAISALFISLGAMVLNVEVGFGELYPPLVNLTVLWAMMDPETPVLFLFFPMQLRWLAVIVSLMLLFEFGNPLGFFALGGCLTAYLYARFLRGGGPKRPRSDALYESHSSSKLSWLNPFEWLRRWRFKRRFKRLWGS